ncbi:MAG TPA: CBS domain-containing protein [Burkholderiales bacterium]|nr:CBS domain-containing protein [Burkholderiales bacterium]
MLRDYAPLGLSLLRPGSGYAQPSQVVPERVTLEDPAGSVMTDLRSVTAVIILSGDTVEEAHRRMIQRGVRLLLVVDQNREVVGLITATDILGEKPVQAVSQRGIRREELLVRDIMTPQERLEVLDLKDVSASRVGHIVSTLRQAGRQHAVVVEHDAAGRHVVRGLFSATRIARQLGVAIPTSEIARTFSEIEAQLAR